MFESFIGVNFWTALFVLLNTLALFLVMKKYLYGPVMQMITDRQNEGQPPRGTIFPIGYYLKRKHDNIHAKEARKYVFRYGV